MPGRAASSGAAPHRTNNGYTSQRLSTPENICLYPNGEFASAIKIAPYVPDSDGKFIIGDLALFSGRQFRGKIYDVRVWNTTRTPEQIASAYDRLLTGDEEGLVANWQLAVKSGDNIVDVTGRYPLRS
ncbi:MAG: LamG-like jellyroll fold domain-containing protein [Alistipes onderdonkii]